MTRVKARAPSNIALIKYMGKKELPGNIPENASISLTLDQLHTWAEVTRRPDGIAIESDAKLSEAAIERMRRHVSRVLDAVPAALEKAGLSASKERFGLAIRSGNTFPHSSGIASSASSFAAVTLGVAAANAADPEAFARAYDRDLELRRALARLSRQGSGSSCRSFEGPWVEWEGEEARGLETKMPPLVNFVLLISRTPKNVSSSEAHSRVKTSPLWNERVARVSDRERKMKLALSEGDVARVSHLAWTEAWEMHSLFHTSAEPFSYWEAGTIDTLHWLATFLKEEHPPIVTLDAGPNIHLIVEEWRAPVWRQRLEERFGGLFVAETVLTDSQGRGASLVEWS